MQHFLRTREIVITQSVRPAMCEHWPTSYHMLLMLVVSMLASSIPLPFIFKLGVEKGRTAYYVMIGFVCGASVLATSFFRSQLGIEIKPNLVLAILAVVGVGVYALSWRMAITFYKKREIQ